MFGFLFRRRNAMDDYYVDERDGTRFSRRNLYPRFIWHYLVIALIMIVIVGTVGLTSGQIMMKKLILALVSPIGIAWMSLFLCAYTLTLCRIASATIISWFAWFMLTLAGNSFVSHQLITTLERPYLDDQPLEQEPFDVIVVLGGGTTTSPNGEPQLAVSGDRIILAARMMAAGKVKQIICTGTDWQPLVGNDLDISDESSRILSELRPDQLEVLRIKGHNTESEMESLKIWLDENPRKRVGIVTSAWHLPRATRLAEANGIDAVPLAADFRSTRFRPDPHLLVPGATNLQTTHFAIHEYIARVAGQ